jgi:hypothetical protein
MPLHCQFFMYPRCAEKGESGIPKNADDHVETASTELGSKERNKYGGLDDLHDAPPLGTIKTKCPDPPIAQQPFPFKKRPFSPQVMNCANLQIRTHREGKQGHF